MLFLSWSAVRAPGRLSAMSCSIRVSRTLTSANSAATKKLFAKMKKAIKLPCTSIHSSISPEFSTGGIALPQRERKQQGLLPVFVVILSQRRRPLAFVPPPMRDPSATLQDDDEKQTTAQRRPAGIRRPSSSKNQRLQLTREPVLSPGRAHASTTGRWCPWEQSPRSVQRPCRP